MNTIQYGIKDFIVMIILGTFFRKGIINIKCKGLGFFSQAFALLWVHERSKELQI